MAVFFDTGGGDIYGGPTKEAVIAAMQSDLGDDLVLEDIVEVPGTAKMQVGDEDEGVDPLEKLSTLEEEYDEKLGVYCVASKNW